MEWPAGAIGRMTAVRNVYRAVSAYMSVTGNLAQWVNANKKIFEVYTSVLIMRNGQSESRRWVEGELPKIARATHTPYSLLLNYWLMLKAAYSLFIDSPWRVATLAMSEIKAAVRFHEYEAAGDG